jgi:hypothetical protein
MPARGSPSNRKSGSTDANERLFAMVLAVVLAFALVIYAAERLGAWLQANPILGMLILVVVAAGVGIFGFAWLRARARTPARSVPTAVPTASLAVPMAAAAEFASAVPPSTQPAAGPKQAELLHRVLEEINAYQPPRRFSSEREYQMGLHGALQKTFRANIEVSGRRGRPDIEIESIAIEIKGPTGPSQINELPQKANDYLQDHEHLILVLYDLQVPSATLEAKLEWMKHYPGRVHCVVR